MLTRFKLASVIGIIFLLSSCKVLDHYCDQRALDNPGTLIDSSTTSKVRIDTVWLEKPVPVPVFLKDTTKQEKQLPIYVADSLKNVIDSLKLVEAIKDRKLRSLIHQLANKQFHIDTLFAENKFATANAGVRNNNLFLNLYAKDIDTLVTTNVPLPEVHTNTADETTLIYQNTVKSSILVNAWFYVSVFMFLMIVVITVLVVKLRK